LTDRPERALIEEGRRGTREDLRRGRARSLDMASTSPARDAAETKEVRGVLAAVGHTPLVALERLFPDSGLRLYGKLEALNPGGSIKDRPALLIIEEGLRSGEIAPGATIIESSSGNMGVGLAQACLYHGLRFICVVDPKAAEQNLQVLRTYGAEIETVDEPDRETGEFLPARLRRVEALCAQIPGSFWPNQYANRGNPIAHYETTMREIAEVLEDGPDYLFLATSTCGTLRGCGEYIRDHGLGTRIIAVDAQGSMIFGDEKGERHIPGIGAGLKPPHCDPSLIFDSLQVSDADCVRGCRRLLASEAILAGGSSGAVVAAIEKLRTRIPDGSTCVAILCDRGERYLDTIYSDSWVREHCGDLGDASTFPVAELPPGKAASS
jgi:2,3-diaminopropionate biosynthesis protein SbnA